MCGSTGAAARGAVVEGVTKPVSAREGEKDPFVRVLGVGPHHGARAGPDAQCVSSFLEITLTAGL